MDDPRFDTVKAWILKYFETNRVDFIGDEIVFEGKLKPNCLLRTLPMLNDPYEALATISACTVGETAKYKLRKNRPLHVDHHLTELYAINIDMHFYSINGIDIPLL